MDLHKFDFNLLRSLDAILRERNLTQAALHTHVTQQAMSGALKRLREHFQDDLLVRRGRHLQLTPHGQALVEPVRATLRQIEQTLDASPTFNAFTSQRHFIVAMSDYAAFTVLPKVMAVLSNKAPNIVVEVRLLNERTLQDLEAGDIDLCLLPRDWTLISNRTPRDIVTEKIYEDDFVCIASDCNRAIAKSLDAKQYQECRHVTLNLGRGITSLIDVSWRKLGISPPIAATATSFSTMIFMVIGTPLLATVQRSLALPFARMLPLKVLECPVYIERLEGCMHWHASRKNDPGHSFLRETFGMSGASISRTLSHN